MRWIVVIFPDTGEAEERIIIWSVRLQHGRQLDAALLHQSGDCFRRNARHRRAPVHLELDVRGEQLFPGKGVDEADRRRLQIVISEVHDHGGDDRRRPELRRGEGHQHFREFGVEQQPSPLPVGRLQLPIGGDFLVELGP